MKTQFFTGHRLAAMLLSVLLLATAFLPAAAPTAFAAESRAVVTTPPTGYTQSSDVVYKEFSKGNYKGVMNWGARGEDCTFLSPNAKDFYAGDYTYDVLSLLDGGTQSTAPSSELYAALKNMMVAEHDHVISYRNTRNLYAYTDCVSNDSSQLVSFYSGVMHTSVWDSGATWNREHVWPNSKCIGDKAQDAADIMMLRPTLVSENGSRGNKAYGESGSYFDPGESVRGDCARILLYQYTRWGNTGKMWGSAGVMENLDILLRWMEEDPVDTWEMGRNDAVQSITGTRNVFVDYPEYAFLLFDREIPADMVTPSGMAASGNTTPDKPDATETEFEMTQPEPPPTPTEPEYEMTQPEPPPAPPTPTEPETPADTSVDNNGPVGGETDGDTTGDGSPDGCASAAGGYTAFAFICGSAFALFFLQRRRKSED